MLPCGTLFVESHRSSVLILDNHIGHDDVRLCPRPPAGFALLAYSCLPSICTLDLLEAPMLLVARFDYIVSWIIRLLHA
jgi:hypothetical protein